jgi:hypothetical protein
MPNIVPPKFTGKATVQYWLQLDALHTSFVGMMLFALSTAFVALMGTCAKLLGNA